MSERRPLTDREISIVLHLALHCGMGGVVVLKSWQRALVAALWRLGLVEIWYRQSTTSGMEGPFYGLTDRGKRLAATLFTKRQAAHPKTSVFPPVGPNGATQPKEKSHERARF